MNKNLVARCKTSIEATKDKVWEALVTRDAIKQYMFGAYVESDWSRQSEIAGKGKADKPENYHVITFDLSGSGNETEISLSQDRNSGEKAESETNCEIRRT